MRKSGDLWMNPSLSGSWKRWSCAEAATGNIFYSQVCHLLFFRLQPLGLTRFIQTTMTLCSKPNNELRPQQRFGLSRRCKKVLKSADDLFIHKHILNWILNLGLNSHSLKKKKKSILLSLLFRQHKRDVIMWIAAESQLGHLLPGVKFSVIMSPHISVSLGLLELKDKTAVISTFRVIAYLYLTNNFAKHKVCN